MMSINRNELNEFAKKYPNYPVDYISLLLEGNNNDKTAVSQILSSSVEEVIAEVKRCAELHTKKRQKEAENFKNALKKAFKEV